MEKERKAGGGTDQKKLQEKEPDRQEGSSEEEDEEEERGEGGGVGCGTGPSGNLVRNSGKGLTRPSGLEGAKGGAGFAFKRTWRTWAARMLSGRRRTRSKPE